jgi:hypothetical protein
MRSRTRLLAALVLLAAVAALALLARPQSSTRTQANPFYCVDVMDGQGRVIYTVCVPDPLG